MQTNLPFLQQLYLQTAALQRANQLRAACLQQHRLANSFLRVPTGQIDCHAMVAERQADLCLARGASPQIANMEKADLDKRTPE